MLALQRSAGAAALLQAFAYVAGFAAILGFLNPGDVSNWSSMQRLEFVLDRKLSFQALNIFIYVIFGAALVVLTIALHERLKRGAPALSGIAGAFGLIWAGLVIASGMIVSTGLDTVADLYARSPQEAASAWVAIGAIQNGIGGGIEFVGGLWLVLVSLAAHGAISQPKLLNYLGIFVGSAGILTVVPPLAGLGAVFGLGQIVWFVWTGFVLLKLPAADSPIKPMQPGHIG